MRILHVTPFFAPHLGGVETHVMSITQELVAAGHDVSILTYQHDPALDLTETLSLTALHPVQLWRLPYSFHHHKMSTWRWMWQHRQLFQTADVIHVHDVWWWIWPVYFWSWRKVFITFHGWETQYPVRWQAKVQRWLAARLSQGSMHVGEWIHEFYWDRPTAVTYGGVPVKAKNWQSHGKSANFSASQISRSQSQTQPQQLKLVFVGRLALDNEVHKYIQLVKLLKKKYPQLTMTWVGDGELAPACRAVGQVTGMVTEYDAWLAEATVVCASSYLSLLAAQAHGKLVVAFYSQHLKKRYLETYPGAQFMMVTDSVAAAAEELIERLSQPRAMTTLARHTKQWAEQQTWQRVTNQYLKLWQKK